MKKRVAVVLPYFGNGGAENMVSRVVSHINLASVDVEVICVYGTPLGNRLEKEILEHGVCIKYIGKGKGFSITAMTRLWKELTLYNPDVINTHLSACVYCIPWVLNYGRTMLHTVHNIPERELIVAKQIPMRFMYKIGKAIPVAISEGISKMVADYYHLQIQPDVITNPVDIERFNKLKKEHDRFVIVTAGRLSEQKNQKFLIETVGELSKEIHDLRLIILGDGPLKAELSDYIREAGLNEIVELVGNVENIEDYYAKADIFALSSLYEGVPLVILEAMAAGLPIISTDVGGIKDILGDGGILVPAGDKFAYKNALRNLISDKALMSKLGKKASEISKRYDSSVIADKYLKLFLKYT